jgi:membrane-bound lytic murein transglycosylase D
VPRAIDLRRAAEWAGTSIDQIQSLNPGLRRWTTPMKHPEFELKLPSGTGAQFQARLAEATPADFTTLKWYTVKKGETLATVARKLKVNRVDLAEANSLSIKSRVRPGQELVIPRAPATLLASHTERAAPAEVASRALSGSAPVPRAERSTAPIVYRVKRGDTLSSIARAFDTTVDNIKSWNKLQGNRIAAGARLKILSRS